MDNLTLARKIRKLIIESDKYLRTYFNVSDLLSEFKNEPELNLADSIDDKDCDEFLMQSCFDKSSSDLSFEFPSNVIDQSIETKSTQKETLERTLQTQEKKPPSKILNEPIEKPKEVHRGQTQIFQCAVCGKICRDRTKLNSHEKTHETKPQKKEFICDHCGKEFALKSYIYSHIANVHIQDKKYLNIYLSNYLISNKRYLPQIFTIFYVF